MPQTFLNALLVSASAVFLSSCTVLADPAGTGLQAVIEAPERSADHKARDAQRMPAKIIAFSGINRGDKVVEIAPASGYYTALLSRIVGPNGQVIGIGPERLFEKFPNARNSFQGYIDRDPRPNVTFSSAKLDEVILPGDMDQIWMVLYYHDTYWTGENRAEMNKRFYDALRPGGVYFVIDHVGRPSSEEDITQSLHRLEAQSALAEIQAAGFRLTAQSEMLRNADDPRDISVFDKAWRGRTDRVVWKFVKPK